jgi:hypothetical protein
VLFLKSVEWYSVVLGPFLSSARAELCVCASLIAARVPVCTCGNLVSKPTYNFTAWSGSLRTDGRSIHKVGREKAEPQLGRLAVPGHLHTAARQCS